MFEYIFITYVNMHPILFLLYSLYHGDSPPNVIRGHLPTEVYYKATSPMETFSVDSLHV